MLADGLTRLAASGARTIGLDLLLAEAEPSAVPAAWRDRLRQALGAIKQQSASDLDVEQTLALLVDDRSGDRDLAAVIADAGNVVLPFSFGFGEPTQASPPEPPSAVAATAFRLVHGPSAGRARVPLDATSLLAPIPELGRRGGQPRPHQRRARSGRRSALRVPGHPLRGRRTIRPSPWRWRASILGWRARTSGSSSAAASGWAIAWSRPTIARSFVVNYRGPDRFHDRELCRAAGRRRCRQRRFEGKVVLIGGSRRRRRRDLRHAVHWVSCRGSNGAPR